MNKYWPAIFVILASITQTLKSQTLSGFNDNTSAQQLSTEKKFDNNLDTAEIDFLIKEMSAHPHHVGSPGDKAVTEYIFNKYKSWGFDVHVETFYVLFPTPKFRLLEMTSPQYLKLH